MQGTSTIERKAPTGAPEWAPSVADPHVPRRTRIKRKTIGVMALTLIVGAVVGYGLFQTTRPDVDRGRAGDTARPQTKTEALVNQGLLPREALQARPVAPLYCATDHAVLEVVARGIIPDEVLQGEPFRTKRLINKGLIPRESVPSC